MTKTEYLEQREAMLNEAQAFIDCGEIENATSKREEIEKLDADFENAAVEAANLAALKGVQPEKLEIVDELGKEPTNMSNVNETKVFTAASEEYRSAWLKNMAVRDGQFIVGTPTDLENEAFTFVTTNSPAVVPQVTLNRIIDLVESQAPLYRDATKSNMEQGFGIPRLKSIDAGDAKVVTEGTANDDEKDTFDLLTLTGEEIKKHLVISRKMKWKTVDAFETWVVNHLAARIAVAKDKHIMARLDNATYGIDAKNIITKANKDDAAIRNAFALIAGTGAVKVYANRKTIYNTLFGIKDLDGRSLFIPSAMAGGEEGRIYGSPVEEDGNIADDVAYIGIPASILANDYEELFISNTTEAKTFNGIVGGYSLFDAGLENPRAFVKITFNAAAG